MVNLSGIINKYSKKKKEMYKKKNEKQKRKHLTNGVFLHK